MSDPIPARGRDEHFVHAQRFAVDFRYDVHFVRDVFAPGQQLLLEVLEAREARARPRVFVCVDSGLAASRPELVRAIKDWFHREQARVELVASPELVPGGEEAKTSWSSVRDLMVALGNAHMDRQSYVLAIGGGSVLDMVGLVAALVHRGLRLVRMPSTVLAQNDAGVGVKNGMNEHGVKNFVGTFAPPWAVINDYALLGSLSDEHWRGGISEAFKVAIIKDPAFFDFLCANARRLRARVEAPMEELIRRCAVLHLDHIATSGDPFEQGTARPLDFGHWAAHKLEALTSYGLSHGLAVALGVALDSVYAQRKGLLSAAELERILRGLGDSGLPVWHEALGWRDDSGRLLVLDGLEEFREHLGGRLTITLPRGIGQRVEVHHVDPDLVEESALRLRNRPEVHRDAG